ncbi:MAG: N-acetylglucosamine-6-phosphate deacetylase [Spirochaetales bacterium]|nr:N-acetylglucosamine-6-phosphate deacetylase [Spirochaetales bacterium]
MSTICLINGTIFTGITTLKNSSIIISDGIINDVMSAERFAKKTLPEDSRIIDLKGAKAAPGFIDSHIHGIGGFGTEDCTPHSLLKMSMILPEYGVTGFCPTIYPQPHDKMLMAIRSVVDAMGQEKGAEILGIHMEGPFISPEKAGVQRSEFMRLPDIELMKEFWKTSEGKIISMTVAPELKGMRELSHYCLNNGIILQAGHSNANYNQMVEGIQAGIIHSTHFFNAMRRLHHRDPGVAGAILIHPEVSCEIIPDGYHVHPALIKLLLNEKPVDKIIMVTDALKPTMQKSGTMIANGEEVYLDAEDGNIFRRKSDDVIAGSSLTMLGGVKYLTEIGIPLENGLRMAGSNPAQVLGLQNDRGTILPGKRADITVFNDYFDIILTMREGKIVTGLTVDPHEISDRH